MRRLDGKGGDVRRWSAMALTLVVLAAGLGSRYGGLKQMEGVGPNGEALLEYALRDAARAGFDEAVVVLRRDMAEAFAERFGEGCSRWLPVQLAFQELDDLPGGRRPSDGRTKPWGTGHAVYAARHAVSGPFAVINADDWYGPSAYQVLADFLRRPQQPGPVSHCLVGYRLANTLSPNGTVSRGVAEVDACGRLVELTEHTRIEAGPAGPRSLQADGSAIPLAADALVSMNLFGFGPEFWPGLERDLATFLDSAGGDLKAEFYLPAAVNAQVARGEAVVEVQPTAEAWMGVTYPEDRATVRAALSEMSDSTDRLDSSG